MQPATTYCIAASTILLVLSRPALLGHRLSPALGAGLGVLALAGFRAIGITDVGYLLGELWRSFVVLASIMVMTEVATRVGLLNAWARRLDARSSSTKGLFARLFILSVGTAATLNNDAAILLLTPLAVTLVSQRFDLEDKEGSDRSHVLLPVFAFGVFMGAGVAPFVVSNPMNMLVADYAEIGFNDYAYRMIPVAAGGWLVAFTMMRFIFRKPLALPFPTKLSQPLKPFTREQFQMMAVLFISLASYPLVSLLHGPVWLVACGAAVAALTIERVTLKNLSETITRGIAWETLAFLVFILLIASALQHVGLVDFLAERYSGASNAEIAVTSAVGSAVLNNHPMAYINMLGLEAVGQPKVGVLAALIGGDLGPRLLPTGSLAGLLWIELLSRRKIKISLWRFVTLGFWVTVPSLILSVWILNLF